MLINDIIYIKQVKYVRKELGLNVDLPHSHNVIRDDDQTLFIYPKEKVSNSRAAGDRNLIIENTILDIKIRCLLDELTDD